MMSASASTAGCRAQMKRRSTNQAIETSTVWDDTGYDCDHCGGRILKRTDRETGVADRSCFQCEQCGCQWTLENKPLRVGRTPACRAAQRQRAAEADPIAPYSRWLLLALGLVVTFGLLRFGGGVIVRLVVPAAVAAATIVAAYLLVRHGRQQGWW